jgi:hypothetical protein
MDRPGPSGPGPSGATTLGADCSEVGLMLTGHSWWQNLVILNFHHFLLLLHSLWFCFITILFIKTKVFLKNQAL